MLQVYVISSTRTGYIWNKYRYYWGHDQRTKYKQVQMSWNENDITMNMNAENMQKNDIMSSAQKACTIAIYVIDEYSQILVSYTEMQSYTKIQNKEPTINELS